MWLKDCIEDLTEKLKWIVSLGSKNLMHLCYPFSVLWMVFSIDHTNLYIFTTLAWLHKPAVLYNILLFVREKKNTNNSVPVYIYIKYWFPWPSWFKQYSEDVTALRRFLNIENSCDYIQIMTRRNSFITSAV